MQESLNKVDALIEMHLLSLEGWCDVPKGKRMARLVLEAAALFPEAAAGPLCVELGVFGARVLVCLGIAVKHCLQGNGQVHGIDPYCRDAALEGDNSIANAEWWSKVDYAKILAGAIAAINKLDLKGVRIIVGRSETAVEEYKDGTIDLLHVDANHSTLTSQRDVALWAPKMRPGGFLAFDDTNWETTKPAQQDLIDKGFTLVEQFDTWAIYRTPAAL